MLIAKLKLLHNKFLPSSVLLDPKDGRFGVSQEGLHIQKPLQLIILCKQRAYHVFTFINKNSSNQQSRLFMLDSDLKKNSKK